MLLVQAEGGLLRCIWPAQLHPVLRCPLLQAGTRDGADSVFAGALHPAAGLWLLCPQGGPLCCCCCTHLNGIPEGDVGRQLQVPQPQPRHWAGAVALLQPLLDAATVVAVACGNHHWVAHQFHGYRAVEAGRPLGNCWFVVCPRPARSGRKRREHGSGPNASVRLPALAAVAVSAAPG